MVDTLRAAAPAAASKLRGAARAVGSCGSGPRVRGDLRGGEAALKGLVLHGGLLLDAQAGLLQQLQGFLHVGKLFLRGFELQSGVEGAQESVFGGEGGEKERGRERE
jgi:hypothetical protein